MLALMQAHQPGREDLRDLGQALVGGHELGGDGRTERAWLGGTLHATTNARLLIRKCRDLPTFFGSVLASDRPMRRKRHLPPSPLAPRRLVRFDLTDPEQRRATVVYWRERISRLLRDKTRFPSEFDRLIADAEGWCHEVATAAGLRSDQAVPDELYPQAIWYAAQIRRRAAEIRDLRERYPDLALGLALFLGELIGEARAHLAHGEDAARGMKAVQSARAGHEQVHGNQSDKQARWRAQYAAFERYRAQGCNITKAQALAAKECGVSPRIIFEARKRGRII
jgi:hypothetical protein